MPSAVGFPSTPTVGQQWPTASPRWQWDGTRWAAIAGELVTNRLTALVNTDDFIALRTIAGEAVPHMVAASVVAAYAGAAPAASAPAALTVLQWDVDPIAGGLRITVSALPSDGGSAITALQYRLNGGAWTALGGATTGTYDITGLPVSLHTVELRAVNAVNPGDPSDTKSETPAASGGGGGALSVVGTPVVNEGYSNALNVTIPAVGVGNSLVIVTRNDKADTRVDGAVEDAAAPSLYAGFLHFFSIENITDGRTSVTIRTYDTYPTPADASTVYAIYELNASGLVVASAIATSNATGTVVATPFTTTEADAFALADIAMSNSSTQVGANGWAAVPGTPSGYVHSAYNANVGVAGPKAVDVTLGDSRQWHASVLAYARA